MATIKTPKTISVIIEFSAEEAIALRNLLNNSYFLSKAMNEHYDSETCQTFTAENEELISPLWDILDALNLDTE